MKVKVYFNSRLRQISSLGAGRLISGGIASLAGEWINVCRGPELFQAVENCKPQNIFTIL
jgi:hypothetical protein